MNTNSIMLMCAFVASAATGSLYAADIQTKQTKEERFLEQLKSALQHKEQPLLDWLLRGDQACFDQALTEINASAEKNKSPLDDCMPNIQFLKQALRLRAQAKDITLVNDIIGSRLQTLADASDNQNFKYVIAFIVEHDIDLTV